MWSRVDYDFISEMIRLQGTDGVLSLFPCQCTPPISMYVQLG